MVRYDLRILNGLVDSYEKSLLSRGENKVAIHVAFPFNKKTMPEYFNESSLAYEDIHAVVKELEGKGFLSIVWKKGKQNHIIQKLLLSETHVDAVYSYLKRTPKVQREKEHLELLEVWERKGKTPAAKAFIQYLKERIESGKSVKEFIDLSDKERSEKILTALISIEENQEDCYIREFSIRHFGDSKTMESLFGVVGKIMRRFSSEFEDMDIYSILAEYSIYHTPDYVYMKGQCLIAVHEQSSMLDLSALAQGIGLSGADIKHIRIYGKNRIKKVITIENLTTFFRWEEESSLIIYLGGYHNSVRRELLCRVYEEIPDAEYLHFGDIDIGGFEIYRDLCRKTGIPFRMYHMGMEELKKYEKYTKKLTDHDRKRLEALIEKEKKEPVTGTEVLLYMEKYQVKLEQEAVELPEKSEQQGNLSPGKRPIQGMEKL